MTINRQDNKINYDKASISELYLSFGKLENKGWSMQKVCESFSRINNNLLLPIISLHNNKSGPALWIIAGIHGEEPAGPTMLARNIDYIARELSDIPTLILPLCNPQGYLLNQRYLDETFLGEEVLSVGDAEHMLLNDSRNSYRSEATNDESVNITEYLLNESTIRPPALVIDLHEDNHLVGGYIYSQGTNSSHRKNAQKILAGMEKFVNIQRYGVTRFHTDDINEKIIEGVIDPVRDGSIDEFIAAKHLFYDGKIQKGIGAKTVYTIETASKDIALEKRVLAQQSALYTAINMMREKQCK